MATCKEDCGCRSNGREWTELCAAHRAEFDERHAQALADYRGVADAREAAKKFEDLL